MSLKVINVAELFWTSWTCINVFTQMLSHMPGQIALKMKKILSALKEDTAILKFDKTKGDGSA